MSLSKLHKKCQNCKHKNNCDNKRMVACGYLPTTIQVNINVNTGLEEDINKQLEKQISKKLNCNFCFDELRGLR